MLNEVDYIPDPQLLWVRNGIHKLVEFDDSKTAAQIDCLEQVIEANLYNWMIMHTIYLFCWNK